MLATVQATELYYTNRNFTAINFNIQGNPPLVALLNSESKKLTNIVQGAAVQLNTNADATYAIEKQMAIPFCYGSPEGAWEAAVAYNGTPSNHPGTFDNVGWVRGTTSDDGAWGAYLWIMQNKITFLSSTSALWTATNGISVTITNVMVGSLGDYQATSNVVDIGPHLDGVTNYPGSNQWESKDFWVDITNVYYQLSIPDIWISPRSAYAMVNGSNVQFTVTGTNIPLGVTWAISPVLTNGAGVQSNSNWQAEVTPGNVATNYKVRARSVDNTNFYDEVNLAVFEIDIEQTVTNVNWNTTNITLNLTADSFLDYGTANWSSQPAGISGSGTAITFSCSSLTPTTYVVRAQASLLTNCFDTCTVTVIKVEIEKCASGFLPQGGTNDNTTTIRAYVTPDTVKGKFKFILFDVSDEPGYCMNAPISVPGSGEDSDAWKDFQFPSQTDFTISGSDSNIAETVTNDLHEATVTIKSFDYGSYGKIKAEFTTQGDGLTCVAKEVGGTNEYTKLPVDTNGNDIADSWSGDTGPNGGQLATHDTDDNPAGDGADGDQLSRYQEYRGFIVQSDHIRTDPVQKDVFCRNHNITSAGLSGFLTTANLGTPVHAIQNEEWTYVTRRINEMSKTATLSPDLQTAIKVEDAACSPGAWGETLCTAEPWVPNKLTYCRVDVTAMQDFGTTLSAAIDGTTNVISVGSAVNYRSANGAIQIDNEIILYSGTTTTTFTGCTRGAMGTTAAAHVNATGVRNFANSDEAIQAVFGHEAGHVIGLEDFYGSGNNHIMNGVVERGSYLNSGYWSTYAPALSGEFRVKP